MSFFDWYGFAANTLGIITASVAIPAVIRLVFAEPRRRRRLNQIISNVDRSRSAVLAIGLGKMASMEGQVKDFVSGSQELMTELGELKKGENFFLLEKRENMPEPAPDEKSPYSDQADKYLGETITSLQKEMIRMAEQAVRKIHLFYQGPAILLAPIGAALSNRFTVICYHYSRQTGYYCIGLMQDDR